MSSKEYNPLNAVEKLSLIWLTLVIAKLVEKFTPKNANDPAFVLCKYYIA